MQEEKRTFHLQARIWKVKKTCIPPGTDTKSGGVGAAHQIHFLLSVLLGTSLVVCKLRKKNSGDHARQKQSLDLSRGHIATFVLCQTTYEGLDLFSSGQGFCLPVNVVFHFPRESE